MSRMTFGTVIKNMTVEHFLKNGDSITARERLIEAERRVGNSSDYVRLAEAIAAFAGRRASGS